MEELHKIKCEIVSFLGSLMKNQENNESSSFYSELMGFLLK